MGACVSVHKDPDSNMKFRLSFGSKTDNLVIPSPVKEKTLVNGEKPIADVGIESQRSTSNPATAVRDFGSKEETFFDSQPWLESDCDDDFLSVNGDFTPSRGNTPVHHSFSPATPQLNRVHVDDKTPGSKPEPSPKKMLSELFRGDQEFNNQTHSSTQNGLNGMIEAKSTLLGLPPKSVNSRTPFASGANNSVCSSERTPNGDYRPEKEKQMKETTQCCLPRMLSSCSLNGRKKTSPAGSIV